MQFGEEEIKNISFEGFCYFKQNLEWMEKLLERMLQRLKELSENTQNSCWTIVGDHKFIVAKTL